jgi:hypothetical protein
MPYTESPRTTSWSAHSADPAGSGMGNLTLIPCGNTPPLQLPPSGVDAPRFSSITRSRRSASPRLSASEYGVVRPSATTVSTVAVASTAEMPGSVGRSSPTSVDGAVSAGSCHSMRLGSAAADADAPNQRAPPEPATATLDTSATRTRRRTQPVGVDDVGGSTRRGTSP